MNSVAAIIEDLSASQNSFYMIKEFNKLSARKDMSMSMFYVRPSMPVIKPFFSCRNISFLSGFNGTAIATNIANAKILLKSHNNCKKYLYMWDLEWLKIPSNFSDVCDTLLDKRLNLIARSESHASVVKNFCNKDVVAIIDNWNMNQILSLNNSEEKKCLA
jgi:hypothetical protein|tara:strand:- start:736 stop:1218 length:483 start_codon:yes stop_codon:yes gene_type:complete